MPLPRWTRPVVALVAATGLFLFLHGDGRELADHRFRHARLRDRLEREHGQTAQS